MSKAHTAYAVIKCPEITNVKRCKREKKYPNISTKKKKKKNNYVCLL